MHTHSDVAPDVSREAAGARSCRITNGSRGSLTRYVRSSGSAFCLAAFCPAGRPPGYGGDRRVGLVQRFRCPGRRITAPGGQRQAMHERPGQRQGDSQQQPHPQAPGEKCPHVQGPFVVPREVPQRYPPCPGLTTKPSGHSGNSPAPESRSVSNSSPGQPGVPVMAYSQPDIRDQIRSSAAPPGEHHRHQSARVPATQRASDESLLHRLQAASERNRNSPRKTPVSPATVMGPL